MAKCYDKSMKNLREYIREAEANHVAIGHFNISNIEALWAIYNAAKSLNLPVIIGVSEGERDFVGVKQAVALVKSIREENDYPIFINADHTYSFDRVKEAIDAGFDSVIVDGAKLSFEENVALTKQCVEYARSVNPEIIIEGELGYIGQSSKILDGVPEGVTLDQLTTPEDAKKFVEETGIDALAPSIGNIHGMMKGGADPRLNIERIKEIKDAAGVPLVLHGGSGNDADFSEAIKAGISVVHINTELRATFTQALKISLHENPDEVAPYKILKPVVAAMQKMVENKLKTFNHLA